MKTFKHLFTALLLLCATVASAHDFEAGGIYYNIIDTANKTVEVTYQGDYYYAYSNEYTGSVVIPESVTYNGTTYSVTFIGDYAFYNCTGLTSITIPNSVKSIEDNAFEDCTGLTSIVIPSSVTSIEESAFNGCTGLTSITIPNSVTSIEDNAFSGCTGLTSITIPNSVTSIGDGAFSGCTGLTSITIPNSVTSIGYSTFQGCTGLTSITIPNSVTSIESSAFSGCTGLTSIEFNAENCTEMGGSSYPVFSGCTALSTVTFGENVKYIPAYAFYGCKGLTSVVIPNSITSIGNNAFAYCSGLTSIEFNAENCTTMGSYDYPVFSNCTALSTITIGENVKKIQAYAFYNCTGLKTVINFSNLTFSKGSSDDGYVAYYATKVINAPNGYIDGDYVWYEADSESVLAGYIGDSTELALPSNYNSEDYTIGANAFNGNTTITSITIPNSVTSIGYSAFYGCTGLTSVTIPNSVTSIGNYAFYNCTGLKSVVIGNSVTSIGNSAFYGCKALTSITIPNSVTNIGNSAFYYCTRLKSVVIGNSVTSIGNEAFYGCKALTSITIPNSVTNIGDNAFYGCYYLGTVINFSNLTFGKGEYTNGYVAYYANKVYNAPNGSIEGDFIFGKPNDVNTLLYYLGNTANLILPTDYKGENYAIGANVFKDKTTITSVTIPNSVTSIGSYAFYGCEGLTSITIPNSVTSIGSYAFEGCGLKEMHISDLAAWCGIYFDSYYANPLFYAKNLYLNGELVTELVIPEGVKEIKYHAFNYCTKLTSIEIPNSVTSIRSSAFSGCKGLTSIIIPNSVTSIGSFAFSHCTRLTNVVIGNSVTSIGDWAFRECTSLTSVTSLIPADELFAINSTVFDYVDKTTCTLYVPYGAKETYAATNGWKAFANIVELEPATPAGDINNDGEVNVGDFAALVNIIFNSESIDDAVKSISDINADGEVNVGDFAALVNLIFNSGSQASPQRAATRAAADETTFYIEPFSIAAGETKVIPVLMENPDEVFSQLQFDITLPEGLEIPEYFDEEQFAVVKDIKRGSRTKSVYSIQTQPVGGALRVLCTTLNAYAFFTGESGDVLLITVKAADDIAIGDVDIKITNTVLSRQDGTTYKPADCTATVTVTEVPTGIDEMKEQRAKSKTIYDLQGRKVEVPSDGLYIIDSKKVVVK